MLWKNKLGYIGVGRAEWMEGWKVEGRGEEKGKRGEARGKEDVYITEEEETKTNLGRSEGTKRKVKKWRRKELRSNYRVRIERMDRKINNRVARYTV